jgi:hypothetical protein
VDRPAVFGELVRPRRKTDAQATRTAGVQCSPSSWTAVAIELACDAEANVLWLGGCCRLVCPTAFPAYVSDSSQPGVLWRSTRRIRWLMAG